MDIRATQVRELFKSRYPWTEEIEVTDSSDYYPPSESFATMIKDPHWKVEVNDDGVWREFKLKISVEEV